MPHAKAKHVFCVAEELLKTATHTSRLSLAKTQAAWLMFTAFVSLGAFAGGVSSCSRLCCLFV